MTWRAAALALIGLVALDRASRTAAGGADPAPLVLAFSPAAAHAGAEFLIDAEFAGRGAPRVWVGAYRVARSRVHVDAQDTSSGSRRIWGRVPARVPAGDHLLKIATRAGAAVAAKPLTVASCNAGSVMPAGCDAGILDSAVAVKLTVSGASGYSAALQAATAPLAVKQSSDPSISSLGVCIDPTGDARCITIRLTTQNVAAIAAGTVTTIDLSYYDGTTTRQWVKDPGGSVQVVAVSPTRAGLCIDAVLTLKGQAQTGLPKTVNVKGYLVFSR